MADRLYICKVLGDGLTEETAFRNAIMDVLDPQTGEQAFVTRDIISTPNNVPAAGYCVVNARGNRHDLLKNNPDVDFLFDPSLKGVKVRSMHRPTKEAAAAAMNARGVDMSGFDDDSSGRDWADKLVKDHDPSLDSDALDFKD